ncbi:allantoicase [Lates japonicus]|uniref:Allantoicase n=1 Tax=Lates japonicus TaxID=270547 RepID=A0AAD3R6N3_LATJO|nr:allantoicase [Lates japonicus]
MEGCPDCGNYAASGRETVRLSLSGYDLVALTKACVPISGHPGVIRSIGDLATSGNFPDSCRIEGVFSDPEEARCIRIRWGSGEMVLLPLREAELTPDPTCVSHVRLIITPDGRQRLLALGVDHPDHCNSDQSADTNTQAEPPTTSQTQEDMQRSSSRDRSLNSCLSMKVTGLWWSLINFKMINLLMEGSLVESRILSALTSVVVEENSCDPVDENEISSFFTEQEDESKLIRGLRFFSSRLCDRGCQAFMVFSIETSLTKLLEENIITFVKERRGPEGLRLECRMLRESRGGMREVLG